jgi:hypothetical protein
MVAISGVVQNPNLYSVIGTTLTFSPAPPSGTNNIAVLYLGLPVIGSSSPGNTAFLSSTDLTATAGQTVFASAGSYTPGFVQVFRNGARLGNADFTATNGTTITLANAATAGDLVTIEYYTLTSLTNALPLTGGTVTGSTTFNSLVSVNAGIAFPATQVASAGANTLDDYEEGTWTPTLNFSGGTTGIVYGTVRSGRYTKVGRIVTVSFSINLTNKGSSIGDANVSGLPFPSYNNGGTFPAYAGTVVGESGMASMPTGTYCLAWSDSSLYLRSNGATANVGLSQATNFTNTSAIYGTVVYEVI